jgi:hypothetical protein
MPNHEEHCRHSFKEYGVRGDDIHTWMDKPSYVMGPSHRDERHSPKRDLPIVIQLFGNEYGNDVARQIFLDHIILDAQERASSRAKSSGHEFDKLSDPIPSYNGTGYTPSSQIDWGYYFFISIPIGGAIILFVYIFNTTFGNPIGSWWSQSIIEPISFWWGQNWYLILGVFITIAFMLVIIFAFRKKNRIAKTLWNLIN